MAPEGSRMLSAVEEDATCTHREGGLCRARSAGYARCAHCQIDMEARGGVIAVYACAREEGCMAQDR